MALGCEMGLMGGLLGSNDSHQCKAARKKSILSFFLIVLYSTLLRLLPLKFHCVVGGSDWTQDLCDFGIGSQQAKSHPLFKLYDTESDKTLTLWNTCWQSYLIRFKSKYFTAFFTADFCFNVICTAYTVKENSKQIFPETKMSGLSPNSYIHVSVSDLYIPMIGQPILLQVNRWTDHGNI
jgi:hypothetical protein